MPRYDSRRNGAMAITTAVVAMQFQCGGYLERGHPITTAVVMGYRGVAAAVVRDIAALRQASILDCDSRRSSRISPYDGCRGADMIPYDRGLAQSQSDDDQGG